MPTVKTNKRGSMFTDTGGRFQIPTHLTFRYAHSCTVIALLEQAEPTCQVGCIHSFIHSLIHEILVDAYYAPSAMQCATGYCGRWNRAWSLLWSSKIETYVYETTMQTNVKLQLWQMLWKRGHEGLTGGRPEEAVCKLRTGKQALIRWRGEGRAFWNVRTANSGVLW